MCDPAIMSDDLAVKLGKCDELYHTETQKDIDKFTKLTKAENRYYLYGTCDELDQKCIKDYYNKIKEDCYSKVFGV
ncbi:unnamed protein product [Oppiella nova]|uniref:Uncharacterized protein n=1 Tax=Oppiella nova TaxID=334625 RepID=A0A7R9MKQ2_9ACAR|nr:unnamed protein product [Oppiella nova]CAG2179046.1 unnamed protein product [Oppiella nova]